MPRDGSNVMSLASSAFVPATTIASAPVNTNFSDIIQDLNNARPVTAGGTGQTTTIGAHDAFVSAGTSVASASTIAIDAVTGPLIDLTGNVAVTAATLGAGKLRIVRATGTPLLTASANLVVNGSTTVNYQCIAGDLLIFEGFAGSIVNVWVISRAQPAITAIASATTTNIGASPTSTVSITGTTTITAFDTVAAGVVREGTFAGILTLTYDATKLILPGGISIKTAANDRFRAMSLGGGNWIVLNYVPADLVPDLATTTAPMLQGALFGCTLSNDAGTPASVLDIAAGSARDSTNVDNLILASAFTKSIATSWAVGSGNGSLDGGVVGNGTYHVFLIKRPDTGVVDVLTSLSATAPTLPTNYTLFRRIGSIIRAAGAVLAFIQDGDTFKWNGTAPVDFNSASSRSKSALAITVPSGIRVKALFLVGISVNTTSTITLFDGQNTSIALVLTYFGGSNIANVPAEQFTNTSAQIQLSATSSVGFALNTLGWVDTRGR